MTADHFREVMADPGHMGTGTIDVVDDDGNVIPVDQRTEFDVDPRYGVDDAGYEAALTADAKRTADIAALRSNPDDFRVRNARLDGATTHAGSAVSAEGALFLIETKRGRVKHYRTPEDAEAAAGHHRDMAVREVGAACMQCVLRPYCDMTPTQVAAELADKDKRLRVRRLARRKRTNTDFCADNLANE